VKVCEQGRRIGDLIWPFKLVVILAKVVDGGINKDE